MNKKNIWYIWINIEDLGTLEIYKNPRTFRGQVSLENKSMNSGTVPWKRPQRANNHIRYQHVDIPDTCRVRKTKGVNMADGRKSRGHFLWLNISILFCSDTCLFVCCIIITQNGGVKVNWLWSDCDLRHICSLINWHMPSFYLTRYPAITTDKHLDLYNSGWFNIFAPLVTMYNMRPSLQT